MNHRKIPAAALLAAVSALVLTACGSDGGGKEDDSIAGTDQQSRSPAPDSAAPSDDAQRPAIKFPPDAKNVFEDQKTGDARKDAVLADNAQYVNSLDDSIFRGAVNGEVLSFYSTGNALESSVS
ncbi:hypothetical protein ACFU5N_05495 [Streptomyces albidoflavus]